jgi:import inner membrane translocase subunit TIM23
MATMDDTGDDQMMAIPRNFFSFAHFHLRSRVAIMGDSPSTSSQILNSASFSRPGPSQDRGSAEPLAAPSAASVLAAGGYDPAALHPLAQAHTGELDYLVLDDDALNSLEGARGVLPSRGWGDELCYGTGTTYLGGKFFRVECHPRRHPDSRRPRSGLALGGAWGLREGLFKRVRSTAASEAARTSLRVRLNTVLNAVTRRGSFVGNNAGVLALIYNAINSTIDAQRKKHDVYGSVAAGAATGLVWKSTGPCPSVRPPYDALTRSTAGVRPALMASAGLAAGAACWTMAKRAMRV